METFNIYMDELPAGLDGSGQEVVDIQFRVTANSVDDGDPENDAVLAGLDLYDLIEMRDAIQEMIDEIALALMDPSEDEEIDAERMP